MKQIKIGNRVISQETPTYIIAEIGINHQGDINLAKKMVDAAVAAKADCAKFQKRTLSKVYKADVLKNVDKEEQAGQYLINNVIKSELTDAEMTKLAHYCAEKKIDFMCTPWDEDSLAFLATLDVPAYKIGSPDMVNLPLIRQMTLLRKPILISTGMSFI
jgi:sialic acid synthase SpsE